MSWQLLTFISVIFFSFSIVLQKTIILKESNHPIAFSILFQITIGIFLCIYALIFNHIIVRLQGFFTINFLLMITLWVLANIFSFKALKHTEASKFSILSSSRGLFTILASSILLRQSLTINSYIGTALILLGIVVVSIESKKIVLKKKDIFCIIGAMCLGFAITNDKYLLSYFSTYFYAFIVFLLPGISLWLLYPKVTKEMRVFFSGKTKYYLLLVCMVHGIGAIFAYRALQLTPNSSAYAAISMSTLILSVLLSIILLKERSRLWQKIIGAAVSFIGLLLVTI